MRSCGTPTDHSVAPRGRLEGLDHFGHDTGRAARPEAGATRLTRKLAADGAGVACIRVGLIDSFRARRDYLIEMLVGKHPDLNIVSFVDVAACVEPHTEDLDVILYCGCGAEGRSAKRILTDVNLLRKIFAGVPVVVLPAIGAPAHLGEVHEAFNVVEPKVPRYWQPGVD